MTFPATPDELPAIAYASMPDMASALPEIGAT